MKNCVVVVSKKDLAGLNIAKVLIQNYEFEKSESSFDAYPVFSRGSSSLIFTRKDIIFVDYLDEFFQPDLYIFASRHKARAGIPTLTVHSPGNFSSDASHGGNARELAFAPAYEMKAALMKLEEIKQRDGLQYDVSLEVTHHGPTNLKKPLIFIEVGSTPANWKDLKACEAIAETIDLLLQKKLDFKSSIGFGGPHYALQFTKHCLSSEYAMGHICAKYATQFLDLDLVKQMIYKTFPRAEIAFLDWKGLVARDKERIRRILKDLRVEYKKI
jgi:D-aminoacyl-tRNA deacylase